MATKSDIIHAELARIRKKHGRLTRDLVVREAKSPKNVLHKEFDWDDATAAHKHRLERAGEIITIYTTHRVVERKTTIRFPIYVRDPTLPTSVGGYLSLRSKMDRGTASRVVDAELERIESCIERGRAVTSALDLQHVGMVRYFEEMLKIVAAAKQLLNDDVEPVR